MNTNTQKTVPGTGLKRNEGELLNNAAAAPVPREERAGHKPSSTAALGRTANVGGFSSTQSNIGNTSQTPGEVYGSHNPGSTGASIGEKVKGVFAKGHGIGEEIRGNATAAVDSFSGDKEAQLRDQQVAAKGEREVVTGRFEKERNGPGSLNGI